MKSNKATSIFRCLLVISFCSVGFCGKIIYPWNATTAIVKAGENFTVWFDADAGQTVTSVVLRGPYNSINIPSVTKKTGSWTYDEISGNTYNTQITFSVPANTPEDRYDILLNTTCGQNVSESAVRVVKDFKTNYTIFHISDTHLCQGTNINGLPERLFKISAVVDIANIINPEFVFITGDLINDSVNAFPDPQQRADFFYKGNRPADLKGIHGFKAATFSIAGNHDFLQASQPFSGQYDIKSRFWNQYHGLQYHHFMYGSTRFMIINDGWEGFDWGYQLANHTSWLSDVGPGNLRIAAFHKSEFGIMGEWATKVSLGLALVGHNHHLANKNPYKLDGRPILYYADSLREHFTFNLFRINSGGSFTVVNNLDFIEDPNDAPPLWQPRLTLHYAKSNDGTSPTNTATLVNKFAVGFPHSRVRFVMPKGNTYIVSKGTVEQAFDGDSVHVVDVRIAIDPNSTNTIEITPSKLEDTRKGKIL
jgi:hypothetical protein